MTEVAGHWDILTPDLIPCDCFLCSCPVCSILCLVSSWGAAGSLAGDELALAPGCTQSWLVAGISLVCQPMQLAGWTGGCKVKTLSVLSAQGQGWMAKSVRSCLWGDKGDGAHALHSGRRAGWACAVGAACCRAALSFPVSLGLLKCNCKQPFPTFFFVHLSSVFLLTLIFFSFKLPVTYNS